MPAYSSASTIESLAADSGWDCYYNNGRNDSTSISGNSIPGDEHPAWKMCVDALLKELSQEESAYDPPVEKNAIRAALLILTNVRKGSPQWPPLIIHPDLDGGILIQWHSGSDGSGSVDHDVRIYNDGLIDFVTYVDGRVVHLDVISTEEWSDSIAQRFVVQ